MNTELIVGLLVVVVIVGFMIYKRNKPAAPYTPSDSGSGGLERDGNHKTMEK